MLIVIGDKDNLTPAYACKTMKIGGPAEAAIRMRILPGVGHNFDADWLPTYDRKATLRAYAETFRYLERVADLLAR